MSVEDSFSDNGGVEVRISGAANDGDRVAGTRYLGRITTVEGESERIERTVKELAERRWRCSK